MVMAKRMRDTPVGWDNQALKTLADIQTGSTPPTADKSNYGDEFLFVSPADLGSKKYITNTEKKLSPKGFSNSRMFPKGSILFTCIGSTIGKCGISGVDLTSNQQINAVIPINKNSNEYIYYALDYISALIKLSASEQAVPIINKTQFGNTLLQFPTSKDEQKAIVDALSDVDGLIVSLEKLIAKKRDIKTAAMQQLLTGKKRLPGFQADWNKLSIGEHAYLKARIGWQALTTNEYREFGNYRLVTGTDFKNGRIDWSTCWYVDEWRYSQDRNIQLSRDDVLITKDGTIGKVGYVDELKVPATLNSGVFVIRPIKNSFYPKFLYYILSSRVFDEFLDEITAGSTITHLYQKDFVNFEFTAPEYKEQEEISEILTSMDMEIGELQQQLAKTKAIKQGMMQELLTGRTRLV